MIFSRSVSRALSSGICRTDTTNPYLGRAVLFRHTRQPILTEKFSRNAAELSVSCYMIKLLYRPDSRQRYWLLTLLFEFKKAERRTQEITKAALGQIFDKKYYRHVPLSHRLLAVGYVFGPLWPDFLDEYTNYSK